MALKVRSVSQDANGRYNLVVTSPQRWKRPNVTRPDAQPKALLKIKPVEPRQDAAPSIDHAA